MTNILLTDVRALVVHHHSLSTVFRTVADLSSAGVAESLIFVLDNSESEEVLNELRFRLPSQTVVIAQPNRGYGAAVNAGVTYIRDSPEGLGTFTLVVTHEVVCQRDVVARLRKALKVDSQRGVVGPCLMDMGRDENRIWSAGGKLSRVLRLPGHVGWGTRAESAAARPAQQRDWLDGSFCMYRSSIFLTHRFDERYFLYFEETDFHTRLRRSGWRVVCVLEALAGQSSSGIPPYYLGRNLALFLGRFARPWLAPVGMVWVFFKVCLREVIGMASKGSAREFLRGWRNSSTSVAHP